MIGIHGLYGGEWKGTWILLFSGFRGPGVFWASDRPTKVQILVRVLPVLVALLIVHRWTWRGMNAGDYIGRYKGFTGIIWVVVKIMVPSGIPIIVWHLIFRVPKTEKRDHNFDNHPYGLYMLLRIL